MFDSLPPQPDHQSSAEPFGMVPNSSESVGTVPHRSETFRSVPNASAPFRTVPKPSERTAAHTLTVREVARMFEAADVSRTERSIVKWCLPNKHDVARLDAVYDANERKWFITQESVDRAIAEEQARAAHNKEPLLNPAEQVRNDSESSPGGDGDAESPDAVTSVKVKKLEKEVMDLKILNGGKDFLIDQLSKERENMLNQVITYSRQIGQLETKVHQLSAPREFPEIELPNDSEHHGRG
jgi:hypothetical protein